jgi:FkbM family methyltransferase
VNAGANLGFYALPLARWSAPGGRVVAFEPNPATAAILARHVRMNGLRDRVRVETCAVGSRAGHAPLFDTRAGSGISRVGAPHPYHGDGRMESVQVPIVTIDEYCSSRRIRPDWMIVDVEGFELEVLRGARRTILDGGPGLSILVEMHPYMWADEAQLRAEARPLFADLKRVAVGLDGMPDRLDRAGVIVLEAEAG